MRYQNQRGGISDGRNNYGFKVGRYTREAWRIAVVLELKVVVLSATRHNSKQTIPASRPPRRLACMSRTGLIAIGNTCGARMSPSRFASYASNAGRLAIPSTGSKLMGR